MLKVHINTLKDNHELEVYRHLARANVDHPGEGNTRRLTDTFKLQGPHGVHDVFVMSPMGMSLRTFQEMQPDQVFQQPLVGSGISQVVLGLGYFYEVGIVHTGIVLSDLLLFRIFSLAKLTFRSSF